MHLLVKLWPLLVTNTVKCSMSAPKGGEATSSKLLMSMTGTARFWLCTKLTFPLYSYPSLPATLSACETNWAIFQGLF